MTIFTRRGCPDEVALARALSQGADLGLQAHLAACSHCRNSWQEQQRLIALGRELPWQPPGVERQRAVRGAILAAARLDRQGPSRRRVALVAGAGFLAAAVVALLVGRWPSHPGGPPGHRVASGVGPAATGPSLPLPGQRAPAGIQAAMGTRFTVLSGPPHEQVELQEGSLRVSVEPATRGETFRIVTRRGEVEVRGTIFETVASNRGLVSVRVERGRVVVRPTPQEEIILLAGEHWRARPLPSSSAAAHPRPSATAGEGPTLPAEVAFGEGLSRLRAADPQRAARAFERALALQPSAALEEEVWYWRAVALARANAGLDAREALRSFLARFPLSARSGEASVILGRLLQESGDGAGAERHFRAGLHDRSTRVRAAAAAGLQSLAGSATSNGETAGRPGR